MGNVEKTSQQATFLILMSLLDGPKHGYDVAKYIEQRSNGFFRMPFGTLYPLLHRLEKSGFVTVDLEDSESARPKKVYKLTKSGKRHAQEEAAGFQLLSKAIEKMVPV